MFQIDLKSRKSIYQQVVDNLKSLIIKGVLKADDKLPSVRELSKMLLINPNTVSKAYKELEHEGYIYTSNGLGTFVAGPQENKKDDKKISEIKSQLMLYIEELKYAGLNENEARELMQKMIAETYSEKDKMDNK